MKMEATPREVPPSGVDMAPVHRALLQTGRNAYSLGDKGRLESVKGLMRFFGFQIPI
ncbi:MAG: hypothetical protein Greene07147_387 [Parcubacteria group bacterium Greene0714_7]|nr:hypothetical protein [Candidatus Paceibacterota bacterium]MBP9832380.1 hypothetical protein [Candidatus Paceibacterota bacterium]TSD05682.1 MAG: hypothetical protein Greene07147_387 [Parcubacteria group bacterium Greene0714_7]